MRWSRGALSILLSLFFSVAAAQEYGSRGFIYNGPEEDEPLRRLVVDTTLFRLPVTHNIDYYGESTLYYRTPAVSRRRGLNYTTAEQIILPVHSYARNLVQPSDYTKATIYGAQSGYSVGARVDFSRFLDSGWSLSGQIYSRTGRDMFVEGVFSNMLSPQITLSRRYDNDHFIEINSSIGYSMRGVQYGSTSEAYTLVGSNYYNPSWGFYEGEVRNSRVRRTFNPKASLFYKYPISPNVTSLTLEADLSYSRKANSSIGWYDAVTPMPDYYRYMPSYLTEGDLKDYVTNVWRANDQDYTQINWERIETVNASSSDGRAYYVLEDQVEQLAQWHAAAVFNTHLYALKLSYGVDASAENSRNFKKMRDLLGAEYLLDYDLFIDDNYNKTMPLQNNLATPDRKVIEGDRFGYDYSIFHSSVDAILRVQYRARRFDFDIESTIGAESYIRNGYYEKERFADGASLGESALISLNPYTLRATVGYARHADQYYSLKLVSSRLSPSSRNLFLNAAAANFLAPSTCGERITSAAFAFRYTGYWVMLTGEIYALSSREGGSIYSVYDDLTSTMCRASITGIGYSSYGVELNADFHVDYDWKLSASMAAGRYYYDTNPTVELYSDYDLTTISSGVSSKMSGINIGNAPQLITTFSATYFGIKRYILNASSSLAARRYEQPSIVRRSERLLDQAFISEESATAALDQQLLDNIFDVEVSATRFFWDEHGGQLFVSLSVSNLLGQLSRITYAKESDRVTLQSVDDYFVGSTLREGTLQYGAPRTFKLSIGYKF